MRGETAGYAHSTEISEAALRRAAETARLAVGAGGGTLAAAPKPTNQRLYTDRDPFDDAEFAVKVEMLREIDAFVRGLDPRVVQVSASLGASMQEVEILRPEGTRLAEARPMVRLNVSVIVEENGRRESGSAGGGGRYGLAPLMGTDHWKAVAREALRIAAVNLAAEPAPAGVMDVVLGPGWPGILLHEAIGHGLEGDFNRKQTSAFAGLMGKRIAAPGRHRRRRRHHPRPPRLDQLRRRGHALAAQRADRGRHPRRLHAGPAERPADGRGADRQRPPRELRPRADAADDQHLHARRRRLAGGRAGRAQGRHLRRRASAAARSTSPTASSSSPAPRPTG